MKSWARKSRLLTALCLVFMLIMSVSAWASSDDNSLAGLGITTEGANVSPEFSYDIWEYNVTVPAGTTELALNPTPSSELASITDVSGTTLAEDGTATVLITVTSGSGAPFTYTLHVTRDAAPETEAQTEPKTEAQTQAPETEPQTEDSQYVRVDKNTIQEAENTITDLKSDIVGYRETVSLYTKIIYGLIALSVILLFFVINLALKKRDLKAEIRDLEEQGHMPGAPMPQRKMVQSAPQQGQPQPKVRVEKAPKGQQAPAKPARKPKVMPQYEQEKPAPQSAPAPQKAPAQQSAPAPKKEQAPAVQEPKKQPAGKGKKKDVQIDMIDL